MAHVEVHNWREGLSLLQRIKYMMEGQYACDVTLTVGQGRSQETIKAHKFILIAGSPYFESLIEQMSPANDQPITLRDTTPEVIKQVLKFLYREKVDLTPSNVLDVMVTSKKYELPQLTQACSVFLEKCLTPDNASTILTQSITHGDNTLADKCVELISQNTKRVFESDDFLRMSQRALMRVVKNDIMSGVTEVDVYKACMGWAEQRCRESGREISDRSRREALGDVLFEIRFPTMTNLDFAMLTQNTSLLNGDEQASIYQSIALGQTQGYVPSATKFANKARQNVAASSLLFSQQAIVEENPDDANLRISQVVKGEMSAKTTYQRSAKGPVSIQECASNGEYITLENNGSRDENLSGWCIMRTVDGKERKVTLPRNVIIPRREKRMFLCKGVERKTINDIDCGIDSFGIGSDIITKLCNQDGEVFESLNN